MIPIYLRLAEQNEAVLAFRADQYYWRDLGRPEHIERLLARFLKVCTSVDLLQFARNQRFIVENPAQLLRCSNLLAKLKVHESPDT